MRRLPCLFTLIVLGSLIPAFPSQSFGQTTDEAALRTLVERYIEAYGKKDIITLMGSWTLRSPDAIPHLEKLQQSLESEAYAFANLLVTDLKIAGIRATLSFDADVSIAASGETRKEHWARRLALLKEQGSWRIWSEVPATRNVEAFLKAGAEWKTSNSIPIETQFATALFEATISDRETLLAENPALLTPALLKAMLEKGESFHDSSSIPKLLQWFRFTQTLAEGLGDQVNGARAEWGQAELHRQTRNFATALTLFEKVAAQFIKLGDHTQVAKAYDSIGTIQLEQRKFEPALESYGRALAVYQSLNNRTGIADANEEIGSVFYEQKKFPQAIEFFEKALKIREAMGKKVEVSATLNNIGNAYYHQENYEIAIDDYLKAIPGFEANNDKLAIIETRNNLGSAYYSQGNYNAALESYEKALTLAEALKTKYTAATALFGIGLVQYVRGDFASALDALNKNFTILDLLQNRARMPATLRSLGLAHLRQQNYDLALGAYLKCLKIYEEQEDKLEAARLLIEIGGVLYSQARYDLAAERYRQALDYFTVLQQTPGVAASYRGIATVDYARKNFAAALEFYQKALALYESLGDKDEIVGTLGHIASVYYARGDFIRALEFADRATQLAKQKNNQNLIWQSRYTAASASLGLSQLEEARKAYEESIATIEAMRGQWIDDQQAQTFFADKEAPYLGMLELLLAQNRSIEAFAYGELIKVHRLWDTLHSVRLSINKTMSAQEQEQEQRLHKALIALQRQVEREKAREKRDDTRIISLNTQLEKARQEVEGFRTRLYAAHPRLKALRSEAPALTLEEASRLCDTRNALLEFVVTSAKTYLFVLSKEQSSNATAGASAVTSLKAYVLPIGQTALAGRIAQLKTAIAGRQEQANQLARELYDLLLQPASTQVRGKETLVVVPDGVLWTMPFQALQSADGHFLIEEAALVYAPSLTAFQEMSRPRTITRLPAISLLAFGNARLSEETSARARRLNKEQEIEVRPEVENQFKNLSQLYGETGRFYTGGEASEERLKAEAAGARLLQVATPVLLSDISPLYSSILLAQSETGGKQDGLLQAWEIQRLNVQSDLITLTACQSGAFSSGDGPVTFAWSWFVAGTPNLLLSQWKDEGDGGDLMLEFHRQLKQRIAPSKALQLAVRTVLKGPNAHPFYWSRFMLMGAGK
jgi:tetratricopeptide (TPR) repeat protein